MSRVAVALGIHEVRTEAFDGFEGMLLTDTVRSRGGILANTGKGKRRARFTIAHELGHFLMEWHLLSDDDGFRCGPSDLRDPRGEARHKRQETQANQFAIECLAPVALVDPLLSPDPNLEDALAMKARLGISLEASVRRMIERRPEPLAAVWSSAGEVRYVTRGAGFPWVTATKGHPLPPTSLSAALSRNGLPVLSEFQEAPSTAWTDHTDLDLWEQTHVGPKGFAVTLLWADQTDEAEEAEIAGLDELRIPSFR